MKIFLKRVSGMVKTDEVDKKYSEEELAINRFNFLVFSATYFYTFSLFLLGLHVAGRSMVPFIILYSFVPYLTYRNKLDLARILITVCIVAQVLLQAYIL
jgi:hypothetical protein